MNRKYSLVITPNSKTLSHIDTCKKILKTYEDNWQAMPNESGNIELFRFQALNQNYARISQELNIVTSTFTPFQVMLDGLSIHQFKERCTFQLEINPTTSDLIKTYSDTIEASLVSTGMIHIHNNFRTTTCLIGHKETSKLKDKSYRFLTYFKLSQICFFFTMLEFDPDYNKYIIIERIPLLSAVEDIFEPQSYLAPSTFNYRGFNNKYLQL